MEMEKRRNRIDRVITWFVFISLIASVIYAIVGIVLADPGAVPELPHSRLKSDYALMLVQCLLGIGILFLPSVLEKHWKLAITNRMHILFVLFLYCGIVLGEVRSFYHKVPHWNSFAIVVLGYVAAKRKHKRETQQIIWQNDTNAVPAPEFVSKI